MLTIKVGNIVESELYTQPVYIKHIHFVYGEKFYDIITVDGEFESHTYDQLKPKSVSLINETGVDFSKYLNDYLFVAPSDE